MGAPRCGARHPKAPRRRWSAPTPVGTSSLPTWGTKGWIGIYLDGPVDWQELGEVIEESYRLIAPKRLVQRLGD